MPTPVVNRNTSQTPNAVAGRTGTQVTKFIHAPRVYIKTADSLTAAGAGTYLTGLAYASKSNGATPTGWTDLGSVMGAAKVMYAKKANEVLLGIDKAFNSAYATDKSAKIEFSLNQFDDVVLENISGLTASVTTAGSVVSYGFGSEDLPQSALLLVSQNKLDGKEIQWYNPSAYFNFAFEQSGDELVLKVTTLLPFFTKTANATTSQFLISTVFA